MSWWSLLPRLLPAPQVFIRPSRPVKLEAADRNEIGGKVVGVYSGNKFDEIHYIANILHRGERLPKNSVQLVTLPDAGDPSLGDLRPSIPHFGWLNGLAFLGFAISATCFGLSIAYDDGMALLATIFMSMLSALSGLANKWRMSEFKLRPDNNAPAGDVVVQYPQGAFIVVKCSELTARLVYYNPTDRAEYWPIKLTSMYRNISMVNTLFLMGGVICLANAKIQLQTTFAGAYLILNMAYWIVAAWPPTRHWHFGKLKATPLELDGGIEHKTYTEALWKAIAITGRVEWVESADMVPKTPAWRGWLDDALEVAERSPIKAVEVRDAETGKPKTIYRIADWDCRKALSEHLNRAKTKHPA